MIVRTTLLKEKSIIINHFEPVPQMQLNMNRVNMMPEIIQGRNLQCEIKINVNITNQEKKELAVVNVSYIIIAELEEGEKYDKNDYANKLFKLLQSMYISVANDLLRDSPFPPLPLNIKY